MNWTKKYIVLFILGLSCLTLVLIVVKINKSGIVTEVTNSADTKPTKIQHKIKGGPEAQEYLTQTYGYVDTLFGDFDYYLLQIKNENGDLLRQSLSAVNFSTYRKVEATGFLGDEGYTSANFENFGSNIDLEDDEALFCVGKLTKHIIENFPDTKKCFDSEINIAITVIERVLESAKEAVLVERQN